MAANDLYKTKPQNLLPQKPVQLLPYTDQHIMSFNDCNIKGHPSLEQITLNQGI